MKLDWQHVVLLVSGAILIGALAWFALKTAALVPVVIAGAGAYFTLIGALFKTAPQDNQLPPGDPQ